MLFQHTPSGLKKLEGKLQPPPPQNFKLEGYEVETEELLPGQTLRRHIGSPSPFWDHMVAGERYELFWPGAEYALWAWGTFREHWNQEIGASSRLPPHVIPGGVSCSFPCVEVEESQSESEPDDPQVDKAERVPGTPYISVSLEGPSEVCKPIKMLFTVKMTYEGLTSDNHEAVHTDTKPIIIHNHGFAHDNFRLQRRCPEFDHIKDADADEDLIQWKTYFDDEQGACHMIVEDPDVEVKVTDSEFFYCLKPGETVVKHNCIHYSDLHPDTMVGNNYRYQYWGGYVDWWVWGDSEEHASTVVKLPCWLNDHVIYPADNDGRPGIMVPFSNVVEFSVVS